MVNADSVPRRPSDVRFRVLGDEGVVLVQRDGRVAGLSRSGALVFARVDGVRTVREIATALAGELDLAGAAPEQVEADVRSFLGELVALGAIEVSP